MGRKNLTFLSESLLTRKQPHSPIKENDDDYSIRTTEKSFCLEKYPSSIFEILIVVLLNIFFFLDILWDDSFTLQFCVVSQTGQEISQ